MPVMENTFNFVDYAVFAMVVCISLGLGIYHAYANDGQKSTNMYLSGGRSMNAFPAAVSMLVSFVSAILVLGTPAEVFLNDAKLTMRVFGYIISVVISAFAFVPLIYPLHLTSVFEYLELRYQSKGLSCLASALMICSSIFYLGLVLYTPSVALQAVSGISLWLSISLSGGVCTVYTMMGGLRGVIWVDVFHALVMIVGMIVIIVQGSILSGGFRRVWSLSVQHGKLELFDFNPDPTARTSIWALLVGGTITNLTVYAIGQSSMQRYGAVATRRRAQLSVLLNIPGLVVFNLLALLVGLVVFAFYRQNRCDPLAEGLISSSNQIVPYFVSRELRIYQGFQGLFVSVMFGGALSSMSSVLNSLAAVSWSDILKFFFRRFSEKRKTLVTKTLVFFFGLLAIAVAFASDSLGVHVLQVSLSAFGATAGPTLGIFLLGAVAPRANAKGAFCGALIAIVVNLWIAIGTFLSYSHQPSKTALSISNGSCSASNFSVTNNPALVNTLSFNTSFSSVSSDVPWIYRISFLWYSAIGSTVAILLGLLVSLCFESPPVENRFLFVFRRCSSEQVSDKAVKLSEMSGSC